MTRGHLPIEAARTALEDAWLSGAPVVLSAPTGSGKSTCVPLWLAEPSLGARAGAAEAAVVLVVEPRRVACRALAMYLAAQRGEEAGESIGYAVRFEQRRSAATRVLFVTPGVALRMLAAEKLLGSCHTLMLDEFHERSVEMDLLAAKAQGIQGLRLLLCSATLECEALADRLGGTVVRSEGRSYDVAIRYDGQGMPDDADLESRVSAAVVRAASELEGDLLVFLPGRGEIARCQAELSRRLPRGVAELVPVHGGISPTALAAAFAGGAGRRVYLATNVAESSVTLPGVRCVIDSGLVRRVVHRAGRSLLALGTIAEDAAKQRAGRAGRVAPGVCIRLWGPDGRLEGATPPEVEGIELDDFVLRAAAIGLEGRAFDEAPWITTPPAFAVERARRRLCDAGVLDSEFFLTERGRAFGALPVSAGRAALLALAPARLRADLADLVARLEVDRSLVRGAARSETAQEAREVLFAEVRDEVERELVCLRAGDAKRHELDARTLRETRRVAVALRELIGVEPRDPTKSAPAWADRDALVHFVLQNAPHLAFVPRTRKAGRVRRGTRKAQPWASDEGTELAIHQASFAPASEGDDEPAPEAGLVFRAQWLGVGRSARGVGSLLMPCSLQALEAAGLGITTIGVPRIVRKNSSLSIEAPSVWTFANVRREHSGGELVGAALREAAAALLAGGAMYPELVSKLEQACLHREILESMPPFCEQPDPGLPLRGQAWLRHRLDELGLETCEDFALIDCEDLLPDLAARVQRMGADPFLLDTLRKDFPAEFTLSGARYRTAQVQLARRRVVVEPANAVAKKRGEPLAKMLPRYRSFSVTYKQASRVVQLR